ncbi:MAG: helix-turn-helix transcriptional regulator [Desulfatiglandales bacterium]
MAEDRHHHIDSLMRHIGRRVEEARRQLDMSQSELARRAGLGQGVISKMEGNPDRGVKVATLWRIASVLGLSVLEVMGDVETPAKPLDPLFGRMAELWSQMTDAQRLNLVCFLEAMIGSGSDEVWVDDNVLAEAPASG